METDAKEKRAMSFLLFIYMLGAYRHQIDGCAIFGFLFFFGLIL